ncbi:MAG TPA: DUF2933 domain-containing protein [Symbiobacteriaceae bacterium]|jgi:hypothetical protein
MPKRWIVYVGCALLLMVGGYLLWINGYRNLLNYAVFLLCPLMHLFMHRGHGAHNHDGGTEPPQGQVPKQGNSKPACH